MTAHKESFARMKNGEFGQYFGEKMESLLKTAVEMDAAEADMVFRWLTSNDQECAGEYTPELILRVRKIGPENPCSLLLNLQ